MPSLIDQMNILKNLPDQALATEMSRPSGAVPPYLVLSEINRRKDMRQRYDGQAAMTKKPTTTVAQDQLASLAPPASPGVAAGPGAPMASPGGIGSLPMSTPGAPAAPAGIAAAPPTGYNRGGIVHYADGGYVDPALAAYGAYMDPDQSVYDTVNLPSSAGAPVYADGGISLPPGYMAPSDGVAPAASAAPVTSPMIQDQTGYGAPIDIGATGTVPAGAPSMPGIPDFSGISAQYEKQLAREDKARQMDPWLSLMQAGFAIAGGTSPYALTNIGQGGATGLNTYAALTKNANEGTNSALAGLTGIQQNAYADQMKQRDFDLEQQKFIASQDPNSPQNTPQAIRDINYVNAMPTDTPAEQEAKANAMRIITPFAAQQFTQKQDMAHTIAEAVASGTMDPSLQGQYSMKPLVEADLARNHPGLNLVQLQQMSDAAKKNISAMNGTQQLRLRQNIGELVGQDGAPGMLDKLQQVADDWNGSGLPPLNGVNLTAALNGVYGEKGIEKATQFKAELADVTPALAGVFSGGYSPTDKALSNAQDVFAKDTSKDAFDKLITLARTNLNYRRSALDQAPAGPVNNKYDFSGNPTNPSSATPAAATTVAPVRISGDADFEALPPGATFVGPDGVVRKKP